MRGSGSRVEFEDEAEQFLREFWARRSKRGGSDLSSADTPKPKLVQAKEESLEAEDLECMICTEPVDRTTQIWSCLQGCYCILHLWCVYKWAHISKTSPWTCPVCRTPQTDALRYACFCGRVENPPPSPDATPHTCRGRCSRPGPCAHTRQCPLLCHPGPCPPCNTPQTCPCGKATTPRCPRVTCGQPCGKPLSCGRHTCPQTCHEGTCGACELSLRICDCGQSSLQELGLSCADPVVKCHRTCGKLLDCQHPCPWVCHKPGKCHPHCGVLVNWKCQCGAKTVGTGPCHGSKDVFWCHKRCQKTRAGGRQKCLVRCSPHAGHHIH